jgi:hypothetical protein
MPNRAEQDRVGREAGRDRVVRERPSLRLTGHPSDQPLIHVESMTKTLDDGPQHSDGDGDDLGTDPVTGEGDDSEIHPGYTPQR